MGRRVVGGTDEALSPTEFDAIATAATGGPAEKVTQSSLGRGVVGTTGIAKVK